MEREVAKHEIVQTHLRRGSDQMLGSISSPKCSNVGKGFPEKWPIVQACVYEACGHQILISCEEVIRQLN